MYFPGDWHEALFCIPGIRLNIADIIHSLYCTCMFIGTLLPHVYVNKLQLKHHIHRCVCLILIITFTEKIIREFLLIFENLT